MRGSKTADESDSLVSETQRRAGGLPTGSGSPRKAWRRSGRARRSAKGALALALPLVLAGAVGVGCSSGDEGAVEGETARELLENRNWLDAWPQSKDDRLRVYRFTPQMGGGVFQDRTLYRGDFELFNYEVDEEQIRFRFPDSGEVVTSKYEIRRVDGPEPFDLRLALEKTPRGPSTYYGRSAETAEGDALPAIWGDIP